MVDVVQLVRASDCGSECRGFEPHPPPKSVSLLNEIYAFFLCLFLAFDLGFFSFMHVIDIPKILQICGQ